MACLIRPVCAGDLKQAVNLAVGSSQDLQEICCCLDSSSLCVFG